MSFVVLILSHNTVWHISLSLFIGVQSIMKLSSPTLSDALSGYRTEGSREEVGMAVEQKRNKAMRGWLRYEMRRRVLRDHLTCTACSSMSPSMLMAVPASGAARWAKVQNIFPLTKTW